MSTIVPAKVAQPPSNGSVFEKQQQASAPSNKPPKPQRIRLKPGIIVPTEKYRYTVGECLGSGGFGDVYKVAKVGTTEVYAMKTEAMEVAGRLRRLKMEAEVLSICSRTKHSHFLRLFDRGRTVDFKFIVMTFVGPTLDRVRNKFILGKQFSPKTAQRICVQMLEALRDLHSLGYLHRDLKPQNFAIGANDDDRTRVYLLDFGVTRRFLDSECRLLEPRKEVAFMGTQRFAPRVSHRLKEQARKDDLESLCYVMADCYNDRFLPWRGQKDRALVLQLKENFMEGKGPVVSEIMVNMPPAFLVLLDEVNSMRYEDNPPYEKYIQEMSKGIENCEEPYDWLLPGAWYSTTAVLQRTKATAETAEAEGTTEEPAAPSKQLTPSVMLSKSAVLNKSVITSKTRAIPSSSRRKKNG